MLLGLEIRGECFVLGGVARRGEQDGSMGVR
jgi:hypothetical protein